MSEEAEVARLGARINHLIDDKDWPALAALCAPEVALKVKGPSEDFGGTLAGADFVAQLAAVNGPERRSSHSHSDVVVTVEGDRATLLAHSYGWNLAVAMDPPLYEVWGRMTYRFTRGDEGWRLSGFEIDKWREAGNPAVSRG